MLKTLLETLDGLDEAIQKFYVQKDDKFYLQLTGVNDHLDVANLKNAYAAEKEKRQIQGAELAALKAKTADYPDDFDPKRWSDSKGGKPTETE